MLDFEYYTPTKVFFGKGREKEVGKIISQYGYKKIMLQYGKGSIKANGLYDDIINALNQYKIEVVELGGVEPNPKIEFVRNAVKLAKAEGVELILAVGGGSVIDAAKYTALGAVSDCDVWDFVVGKKKPISALPVACVLTIAAAGSEMSWSAVVSDLSLNMKRGLASDLIRPLFAVCNPELTYTVSPYQTACGITDIMAHTMERYFTPCEPVDITDQIAEGILCSVINAARVVIKEPDNYEARANIMWASSLSHNNLTGCGRINSLPVHQLEHALSGEFDFVAHGAGLAVLFPAWAKYVYTYNIPRFAQFARNVWGVNEVDDKKAAEMGIESMSEFFKSIGMPTTLDELGVSSGAIDRLTELCTFGNTRTINSVITLGQKEIHDIFNLCVS
ncbi:MAG: iron-containing alcohol dehydrogenase [Ruminococcaceae bacterium]|nr:iron-containing alcohol dehydrogenase [Oscillospiraceae bacterium]